MRVRTPRFTTLGNAGTAAIEYALAFPVVLALTLGTMDISRMVWTYTPLQRAVEAAARCASINTIACATSGQVSARAVQEAWGLNLSPSVFTLSTAACGKRVTATFDFVLIVPWPSAFLGEGAQRPDAIRFNVSACYPA
jgi:Flp pilus assembly protein TadG